MTETADRYRRLAERFTALVQDVPADGWAAPSPCEDWTPRDIVDHIVDSSCGVLGRIDRAPEVPADDPVARWTVARDAMQAAVDDPQVAGTEYDGFFGRTTVAETFDAFMSPDLLVHTWDVARATGLDQYEPMPEEEVRRVHDRLGSLGDAIRQPGAFGPEVPVPDDAPAQDRLLGFLGRQP